MSEIIRFDNSRITDTMDKIHLSEYGEVLCCGKPIKAVSHIDGNDYYIWNYACKCGNCISIKVKK